MPERSGVLSGRQTVPAASDKLMREPRPVKLS
jgi:hypothetical protein